MCEGIWNGNVCVIGRIDALRKGLCCYANIGLCGLVIVGLVGFVFGSLFDCRCRTRIFCL